MVPDADSDEEEEEDLEQLLLTKARLEQAPEHLKQIPIVDMINCDVESYQNQIYDKIHGVAQNGNNVDIIMNGESESTNPARDLSIDAKPATHARGVVPSPHSSSAIWTNQDFANKQHDDRLSDTQVKTILET